MSSVLDAWREQIRAHEAYMDALRGDDDGGGHSHGHGHGHGHGGGHGNGERPRFGWTSRPLDPFRTDDQIVNALFGMVDGDSEVLDVGGGAGRLALPLATRTKRVTVVEPSEESIDLLKCRARDAEITNLVTIDEDWEDARVASADIVLCSLVLHHVVEAAAFIEKLQSHAKQRVVLVEMAETPGAIERPFFERVHGSAPAPMPGLAMVLELLWSMDIYPDVKMLEPEVAVLDSERDGVLDHLRRRLSVEEGTDADDRLKSAAEDLLVETSDGLTVKGVAPRRSAIMSWNP